MSICCFHSRTSRFPALVLIAVVLGAGCTNTRAAKTPESQASAPESAAWVDPATASLDPQTRAVLERIAAESAVNVMSLPPAERRRAHAALFGALGLPPADLTNVAERFIPGPGRPLRVRIYTPREAASGSRPVLVYFHGGGMSVGSLEQYDALCQRLAQRSGAIVVSVDYRLAPEHRFPAGVEDAYAAVLWAHRNAGYFGGDPARLAVGGDSAGGYLTAVVTQLARDNAGPPIVFQLLIYPFVGDSGVGHSMTMFSHGYLFGAEELEIILDDYLADRSQLADPRVQPVLARDFSRLPPAFVISAGYEIMRDDIEEYARRLRAAGVPVELHRYESTVHPFLSMAGAVDLGREAIDESADKVRAALAR